MWEGITGKKRVPSTQITRSGDVSLFIYLQEDSLSTQVHLNKPSSALLDFESSKENVDATRVLLFLCVCSGQRTNQH